jgi:predicted transcriptional regulator
MKSLPRRDKLKIYGDILSYIDSESGRGKVVLTQLQIRTNVPFDRLKVYLAELEELGLIKSDSPPSLTAKGREFLREYEKVADFMYRMGLTYRNRGPR